MQAAGSLHVVEHARETMYVLADALDDLTLVAARD